MAETGRGSPRKGLGIRAHRGELRERRRSRSRTRAKGRGEEIFSDWSPVTDIGVLVRHGIIRSLEEIHVLSLPIREHQIIDFLFGDKLKDEVLKIIPIHKSDDDRQTKFRAIVAIGDWNGHVGLGIKCSEHVTAAVYGALVSAKLSVVPVRRGHWEGKTGEPHTVPCKVMGNCGWKRVRLMPAPRGTGIIAGPTPKKILQMAGIQDCYTSISGSSGTLISIIRATYSALANTYYIHLNTDDKDPKILSQPTNQDAKNVPKRRISATTATSKSGSFMTCAKNSDKSVNAMKNTKYFRLTASATTDLNKL
ncbi:40S ribosomal protein S2 [Gryllus bimaculatus]|nr:40S ribosomal protein S2 [Gryllus bimaculatus]